MGKKLRLILIGLLGLLIIIQFVPLDRSNQPVSKEMEAPEEVMVILKNSCYNCHSNETKWPFYSYIAPVSWLVVDDVHEARDEMNFSQWDKLKSEKRTKKIEEIWEEVEEGKMPLPIYLIAHPDAKLDDEQKAIIEAWVSGIASE
jgi:hypothetical protein